MTENRITVSTVVRVDPQAAFRIFTEEIDIWWRRGPRYRFHDGALRFESERLMEADEQIGRVLAWEPGRRLLLESFTWTFRPGEHTEVEVRFDAIGDGTRVTVEHRGWEWRPTAAGEFRTVVGLWWGTALAAMRERATSSG